MGIKAGENLNTGKAGPSPESLRMEGGVARLDDEHRSPHGGYHAATLASQQSRRFLESPAALPRRPKRDPAEFIVGAVEPAEKAREKEAGPIPQSYTRTARLCTNWVSGEIFSSNWKGLATALRWGTGGLPGVKTGSRSGLVRPLWCQGARFDGSMVERCRAEGSLGDQFGSLCDRCNNRVRRCLRWHQYQRSAQHLQ